MTIHSNGPFLHIAVERRYWSARVHTEIARGMGNGICGGRGRGGDIKFVTPSPHAARGNNTLSTH